MEQCQHFVMSENITIIKFCFDLNPLGSSFLSKQLKKVLNCILQLLNLSNNILYSTVIKIVIEVTQTVIYSNL